MNNILITTYRGLSLVSGSISIGQMFEFIRGNVYRDRIRRLREAMDAGDTVKADRMKKQLPYHTITATYAKERLAYSLDKYQDIITLDCDDMPAEKLPEFRQLANDCPDTLGSFVSPRMHGLKIFVYLTGKEAEALRAELNALGTVDFTTPTDESGHQRKRPGTRILRVARSGRVPLCRTAGKREAADRKSDSAHRRGM